MTKISILTARQMAINSQCLNGQFSKYQEKDRVARTIEHLGYVQIDTISVVERSHHQVLWARCPDYNKQMLHDLQAKDRRIFEYWAHAAAFLPMQDYRFYRYKMKMYSQREEETKWRKENKELLEDIIKRIRNEGPLSSKDFEAPNDFKRGLWWNWKPAKTSLEILFWIGELMISERCNFQRVYDLTERILPKNVDITEPTTDELANFYIKRTLRTLGVATLNDFFFGFRKKDDVKIELEKLVEAGEVTAIEIEGIKETTFYALTNSFNKTKKTTGLHLLSPFDNLTIRRAWLEKVFGFEYTLECYVPPSKRKFGYFSFPILYGNSFIGTLDPKADRLAKTLIVRQIHLNDDIKIDDKFIETLASKLKVFANFNACSTIVIEQTKPEIIKQQLQKSL